MVEQVNGNGSAALKLEPTPQRVTISLRDEADLSWFFGPGQGAFERSVFGAMIRRLDLRAHLSKRCHRCDGVGFTDADILGSAAWFAENKPVRGTTSEQWEKWLQKADDHQPRCGDCDGGGVISLRLPRKAPRRNGYKRCRDCRGVSGAVTCECGGKGYLVCEPAFPAGSSEEVGYTPDEGALQRYALVSRRLDRAGDSSGRVRETLGVYYGDVGARWGRTRHGRLFGLYALTPAGKKLLMRGGESGTTLTPAERLGVEAELERAQPKPNRRALLTAAHMQALEMFGTAALAWNGAGRCA